MAEPASLPVGTVVQLSDVQLLGREAALHALGNHWFRVVQPLLLRLGEVIALQYPLDPAYAGPFTPPELK